MGRASAQKDGCLVRVFWGHDIVLLAWNLERDAAAFDGVFIFREDHSLTEEPIRERFQWSDYSPVPARNSRYRIRFAFEGSPPVDVAVDVCIPPWEQLRHAVFFNRGVAGSQAYAKRFGKESGASSSEDDESEKQKWLARHLETALLRFVEQADSKSCALYVCAYEFTFAPFLQALKEAIARGVNVRVILDHKSSKGVPKSTTADALAAIEANAFPVEHLVFRTNPASAISHNKFIVFVRDGMPVSLWTGSTNFTPGGIYGQLNAAHWIKDPDLAQKYLACWNVLVDNPAPAKSRASFDALSPLPTVLRERESVALFSPRSNSNLLNLQCFLVGKAHESTVMTAAFGVNRNMQLVYENEDSADRYLLLESTRGLSKEFLALKHLDGRISVGSLLDDAQIAAQLNMRVEELTGLNEHVQFVHTKICAIDVFSECPIVIFGSGNFSEASCTKNDENQIISRGDTELADQIACHFFRIFDHFRWRAKVKSKGVPKGNFLQAPKATGWAKKHFVPGSNLAKRRNLFCRPFSTMVTTTKGPLDVTVGDFERAPKSPSPAAPVRTIRRCADGTLFEIRFPYDKALVEAIKALPNRQWKPEEKVWTIAVAEEAVLREFATKNGFVFL